MTIGTYFSVGVAMYAVTVLLKIHFNDWRSNAYHNFKDFKGFRYFVEDLVISAAIWPLALISIPYLWVTKWNKKKP